MGKISTILIPEQKIILDELIKEDYLKSGFYFTGGTALSEFYLQHRYSEDLDFFSEKSFNQQIILSLMEKYSKKYKFSQQSRFAEVVYIFNLTFPNDVALKVDFSFYPYKRVKKGKEYHGFPIDSLLDIAVNKLMTVSQRTDIKDFVDLYFLSQDFFVWDLIEGVKVKFHQKIDPVLLASDLLKIEDFSELPRMIKPLNLKALKNFYRNLAKQLGKTAVE